MGFKFIFPLFLILAAMEKGCQAGKGFGGAPGIALINQVRGQLILTQQQVKLAEDTANTTIQNNIAAAQNSIAAEITASQNKVNSGQPQCENQHKASISQINPEVVKSCDQAAQFLAIDAQITVLNSIHYQLGGIYSLCPFWPPGNQALCIQDACEGITTQITDQRDAILEAIATVSSDASKCIGDESQKAQDAITAADKAYNECNLNASA